MVWMGSSTSLWLPALEEKRPGSMPKLGVLPRDLGLAVC